MTRKTNAPRTATPVANIVLKTIHDDIIRANPNSTLTTKKMRVKLRATMRDIHVSNASWLFTQSQYDTARSMFDPAYATKLAAAAKRAARPARASRKIADADHTPVNVVD